jgi:hypothetical protein
MHFCFNLGFELGLTRTPEAVNKIEKKKRFLCFGQFSVLFWESSRSKMPIHDNFEISTNRLLAEN